MSTWEKKNYDGAMEMMRGYAGQSMRADRELKLANRPNELLADTGNIIRLVPPLRDYRTYDLEALFFKDQFTGEDVRKPGDRYILPSLVGVVKSKLDDSFIYVTASIHNKLLAGMEGNLLMVFVEKSREEKGDLIYSSVKGLFPCYWNEKEKFLYPDNKTFETPEYIRVFGWENRIKIYKPEQSLNARKSTVHLDLGCYR